MNYFAHGRLFTGDPYFLAGTATPDWLNVSDRPVRVRGRKAAEWVDDPDPRMAALARGVVQHHRDDAWFHETPAFAELQWRLAVLIREALDGADDLRPSFLGHILIEILLDATLIAEAPAALERYYAAVASVDPVEISAAICRMATAPCRRLAWFVEVFSREQFLWDYLDDGKLMYRLNQVMRRVRLPELPAKFAELLPEFRALVTARQHDLLLNTAVT
jgi:hypothetical protein